MKQCNKCLQDKEVSEFKKDSRNKSGLQGICNDCQREYKRTVRASRVGVLSTVTHKTCNKCSISKTAACFYADAGIADGLATICKECKDQTADKWRSEHREQYNASQRAYNKKHYHQLRLNRYKLTAEQHAQMLLDQKGVCAICDKLPTGKRPLCVDHNHATGQVRALLCYGCNRALHVLENAELLAKAQAYLDKHSKNR